MTATPSAADRFLNIEYQLSDQVSSLTFQPPVRYVYKPLLYARNLHEEFVRKYISDSDRLILFLGINPGPFGMSQTGIPFGNVRTVREWFNITGDVGQPEEQHPKRPVYGLNCKREERSGQKFWGLMQSISGTPENFFRHCFIYNICPLQFLDIKGCNLTPKDIRGDEINQLMTLCSEAFIRIINDMRVRTIIGIGNYAFDKARMILRQSNIEHVQLVKIPHPSQRSPTYRNNWEETVRSILDEHNITSCLTGNE